MKTIRISNNYYKAVGITNGYVTYSKNALGKYRIEAKLDWGLWRKEKFKLYQGSKKPFFRNLLLITIITVPLTPLFIAVVLLIGLLMAYIKGAKNFIKNDIYQNWVREFNWINIILVVVLTVFFLINATKI